jgi:hypothetical protein
MAFDEIELATGVVPAAAHDLVSAVARGLRSVERHDTATPFVRRVVIRTRSVPDHRSHTQQENPMTSTSPLHIDSADLARLKDRMPDLSAMDLPRLEAVGRTADDTIDRLLGRSRAPMWPWLATGIGLIAIIGAIATYLWMRRPLIDPIEAVPVGDSTPADYDLDAPRGFDTTVAVEEV